MAGRGFLAERKQRKRDDTIRAERREDIQKQERQVQQLKDSAALQRTKTSGEYDLSGRRIAAKSALDTTGLAGKLDAKKVLDLQRARAISNAVTQGRAIEADTAAQGRRIDAARSLQVGDITRDLVKSGQLSGTAASNLFNTGPTFQADFKDVKAPLPQFGFTKGDFEYDPIARETIETSPAGLYTTKGRSPSFVPLGKATDIGDATDSQLERLIKEKKKNARVF